MDIDFNMFEKKLNKDLLNDQFIMEEIFNYWACNNNDLANESMIAVLNYIYELGYEVVLNDKTQELTIKW